MSAAVAEQNHHVADIGKILLDVQHDLHALRQKLESMVTQGTLPQSAFEDASSIIGKAESELRAKADLVLRCVNEQVNLFPNMQAAMWKGAGIGKRPKTAGGAGSQTGQSTDEFLASRTVNMRRKLGANDGEEGMGQGSVLQAGTQRGTMAGGGSVSGATTPRTPRTPRSGNKNAAGTPTGKLWVKRAHERTHVKGKDLGVDPKAAKAPQVSLQEMHRTGVLDLMNRGVLPMKADLDAAFEETGGAPVRVTRAPLASAASGRKQRGQRQHIQTSSSAGFNMSSIRLDLHAMENRNEVEEYQERMARLSREYKQMPEQERLRQEAEAQARADAEAREAREAAEAALREEEEEEARKNEDPEMALFRKQMERLTKKTGGEANGEASRRSSGSDSTANANAVALEAQLGSKRQVLHFLIRKGKALDTTPEFVQLRERNVHSWGQVLSVIRLLEKMCQQFSVPLAIVDAGRVEMLANDALESLDVERLMSSVINEDLVRPVVEKSGRRFVGWNGEELAAVRIQAAYRGHVQHKRYNRFIKEHHASHQIQDAWRCFQMRKQTEQTVAELRASRRQEFDHLQQVLAADWPVLREARRTLIHLPSISSERRQRRTEPAFATMQAAQMSRLCDLRDPLVSIIYISPQEPSEDLVEYYLALLGAGGVENAQSRLKIVFPENCERFPEHFSLTQTLLYSPGAMRKLRNAVAGKECVIVPHTMSDHEVALSAILKVPVWGPAPEVSRALNTKSQARAVFREAGVAYALGVGELEDEEDFMLMLTTLIVQNLEVPRWVFKVDNERGGRGHAYLDTLHLNCLTVLMYERENMAEDEWMSAEMQENVYARVDAELRQVLHTKSIMGNSRLYKDMATFLEAVERFGGVIEASPLMVQASPSMNLLIEPNGEVTIQSTHEQFFGAPYCFEGATFPQTVVSPQELNEMALKVAARCFARGVIGPVGVDFVTFWDEKSDSQQIWLVDLNVRPTVTMHAFALFDFVAQGRFDAETGYYEIGGGGGGVADKGMARPESSMSSTSGNFVMETARNKLAHVDGASRRYYVYHHNVSHTNLSVIHPGVLFQMCKANGVSFDLGSKTGTCFQLQDAFTRGRLGLMTVGRSIPESLDTMEVALEFLAHSLAISMAKFGTTDVGTVKDAQTTNAWLVQRWASQQQQALEEEGGDGDETDV